MRTRVPAYLRIYRFLRRTEWPLLILAAAILAAGTAVQWSVEGLDQFPDGHLIRVAAAVAGCILAASVPSRLWHRHAFGLYFLCLIALFGVLFLGRATNNARRWIDLFGGFKLQPSEFTKIALILVLARWFGERPKPSRLSDLFFPGFLTFGPALLILAQPDLGTALSFVPLFFGLAYIAGTPWRVLRWCLLLPLFVAPIGWWTLKDYQRQRVDIWLRQDQLTQEEKSDAGYHLWHSKLAVGSGRLHGFGWGQGPENRLDRLPERHNDFVFPVVAEEFGFFGATGFLLLYASLGFAALFGSLRYRDPFTRYAIAGVGLHFGTHLVLNVGVTLGVWPTTGLPLPMVSWGGSSMMVSGLALGGALAVGAGKEPVFLAHAFRD
ncbi:MAG: rod shape-determining protein RodA [Planctomycetota bacterium]|nr:MAG: rod shape-determining protein RodA [Planctomycetota bacterium]